MKINNSIVIIVDDNQHIIFIFARTLSVLKVSAAYLVSCITAALIMSLQNHFSAATLWCKCTVIVQIPRVHCANAI